MITISPEASVRQAAGILLKNRISALPVVDKHGELIEIISEGDLMRRAELQTDEHSLLNATVEGGVVKLWGVADSEAEKEVLAPLLRVELQHAARVAAEQVAGVQAVENNVLLQPVVAGT